MTLALNEQRTMIAERFADEPRSCPSPVPLGRLLDPPRAADLLSALLAEQSDLTAVQRFAHYQNRSRLGHGDYTSLLPASPPGAGQQYAFEVNLDLCSGCKACVTACHNLNGLDSGEAWRDVG